MKLHRALQDPGWNADGTLAPGGTYQVLISQILGSTDWGDSFQGHVHLLADYTNCDRLGLGNRLGECQPSLFCGRDQCRYRW